MKILLTIGLLGLIGSCRGDVLQIEKSDGLPVCKKVMRKWDNSHSGHIYKCALGGDTCYVTSEGISCVKKTVEKIGEK